jgi:hypothetical protein
MVRPLLKPGNRSFGSASVTYPTCSRARTYIVYIVFRSGGWFSELESDKSGSLPLPVRFRQDFLTKNFDELEGMVPAEKSIPIPSIVAS